MLNPFQFLSYNVYVTLSFSPRGLRAWFKHNFSSVFVDGKLVRDHVFVTALETHIGFSHGILLASANVAHFYLHIVYQGST